MWARPAQRWASCSSAAWTVTSDNREHQRRGENEEKLLFHEEPPIGWMGTGRIGRRKSVNELDVPQSVSARNRHNGNPCLVGALQQRLAIEQQRAPGLDGKAARAGPDHRLNRARCRSPARRSAYPGSAWPPSPRSAAAPVWTRSPRRATASAAPARSIAASVPSMASTATQACAATTTVWPMSNPATARATPSPYSMFLRSSSSGRALGQHAFLGQQRLKKCSRADQLDPLVAQHLGHRAQQHVGVARAQVQQQLGQPPVGPDAGENLLVLHLAGHHRLRSRLPCGRPRSAATARPAKASGR